MKYREDRRRSIGGRTRPRAGQMTSPKTNEETMITCAIMMVYTFSQVADVEELCRTTKLGREIEAEIIIDTCGPQLIASHDF